MFTTRPTLQGTFGMVSSTHWLASQSAMAVLEDGGNAFDAAVAGAFVLHVVEPHLNGPAGEVPILLAPAGGAVRVLCGQGVAPAGSIVAFKHVDVRYHWSVHPQVPAWIHSSPMTGTPRLVVNLTSPQRAPRHRQAEGGGTD